MRSTIAGSPITKRIPSVAAASGPSMRRASRRGFKAARWSAAPSRDSCRGAGGRGRIEPAMTDRLVYVSRLTRLPLVGADGSDVGRVADVVLGAGARPPRVNGFVVAVQRRRVFVGAGRVGEIGTDGV